MIFKFFQQLFGRSTSFKVFGSKEEAMKKVPDQGAILTDADGEHICVARNGEEFYAFENNCPHNHMPLNRGKFNEKGEWVCPYHRHCLDLRKGINLSMNGNNSLKLYKVKCNDKGLFIYK